MKIVLIEDQSFYRRWLKKAFLQQAPIGSTVETFKVDVDFLTRALALLKKRADDPELLLFVLDANLSEITLDDNWCPSNSPIGVATNCKYGALTYDDMRVHGLNIYHFLRKNCADVKIVILSTYEYDHIQRYTGVQDFLCNDLNADFFRRSDADVDAKRVLNFATNIVKNEP